MDDEVTGAAPRGGGGRGGADASAAPPALGAARDGDAPDEHHWLAVKHDYLHSGLSQRRIAEKHGVATSTFRHRIKRFGWVRAIPTRRAKQGRKWRRPAPDLTGPNGEALRRKRIVARLFNILDRKLERLEASMAQDTPDAAPMSAADTDTEARAMTALLGIYTKLAALDDAARAAETAAGRGGVRTDDDAVQLRRELAERIARLQSAEED